MIVLMLSAGCATKYVTAPINPELIKHEADPALEGRTWQDVFEQSLKRGEVIRRWNCKGYSLRHESLPEECRTK